MPSNRQNSTPSARTGRRKARGGGDPPFRFITASDPAQFRDNCNKKKVRSQAMRDFRSKERRRLIADAAATVGPTTHIPATEPESSPNTTLDYPMALSYRGLEHNEKYLPLSLSSMALPYTCAPAVQSTLWTTSFDTSLTDISCRASPSRVTGYQATEAHEKLMLDMLLNDFAHHHRQYVGADGQTVELPTFPYQGPNAMYLLGVLMRFFTTRSTLQKWFPAMHSHHDLIASATVLASAWEDMQCHLLGDSERTVLLKCEASAMLRQRRHINNTRDDDTTLTMMLHLMSAEMWCCYEDMLQKYEHSVAGSIIARGGMHKLGDNTVAELAAAYCHHSAITRETTRYAPFQGWMPRDLPKNSTTPLPESPLFCLGSDFATVTSDPSCSSATQDILWRMRDLTNRFIAYMSSITNNDIKDEEVDEGLHSRIILSYREKAPLIYAHICSLPSAEVPGHTSSKDWVYEACRITAIIYSQAIVALKPFSQVGDPDHCNGFLSAGRSTPQLPMRTLVEKLLEVLERTDLANIWNDMASVLYWVCAVGAAAARTPAGIDNASPSTICDPQQAYPVWVRRCLAMHATRTMVILVAQHPTPIIMAQKKLYKVQELLREASRP